MKKVLKFKKGRFYDYDAENYLHEYLYHRIVGEDEHVKDNYDVTITIKRRK